MGKRVWILSILWPLCLVLGVWQNGFAAPDEAFDHLLSGFPLTGAHKQIRCERCHVRGIFAGTPLQCSQCHTRGTTVSATGKSARHIQTSNVCDDCHTTLAWVPARFDHGGVAGPCMNCHNNVIVDGKPTQHLVTSSDCDACHRTTAWVPAGMDHRGLTAPCFSCHNGVKATGKHSQHIQSANTCDDCHSTRSWTPANFDHKNITGTCSACHNGVKATGKHPAHLATPKDCDFCHSTVAWSPARFDHSGVTGACNTCHNGTTATGKPPQHFVTSEPCETCHVVETWTITNFSHKTPLYPGDHAVRLECVDCHINNQPSSAWRSPAYKPDCGGCHENAFIANKHKKHESPEVFYTVSELRDCTGSCHLLEEGGGTAIKEPRTGKHTLSKDGW